jgi:hypothetical protein
MARRTFLSFHKPDVTRAGSFETTGRGTHSPHDRRSQRPASPAAVSIQPPMFSRPFCAVKS